jgi:hypothetical protein
MNSRYALPIAFAALLSACGGGADLTKDQAKTLLNAYLDKNPTTQPLLTGMQNMGTNSEKEWFESPGGKYQKTLEADGLITITSKGKIVKPDDKKQWFNAADVALTDKGKALVTGTPNTTPALSANTWPTVYENAIFCSKEVVDVTSVATNEDFARIGYTWKAAKLTPFALDFQKSDPSEKVTCNPAVTQDSEATMERKNDVWNVATNAQ